MTSNLGSSYITALGDRNQDEMRAKVMEALHAAFRPEFLNRIDEIVIFTALSRERDRRNRRYPDRDGFEATG